MQGTYRHNTTHCGPCNTSRIVCLSAFAVFLLFFVFFAGWGTWGPLCTHQCIDGAQGETPVRRAGRQPLRMRRQTQAPSRQLVPRMLLHNLQERVAAVLLHSKQTFDQTEISVMLPPLQTVATCFLQEIETGKCPLSSRRKFLA